MRHGHAERGKRHVDPGASGLAARGRVSFAAFDSPATLPFLRCNEWIDLA